MEKKILLFAEIHESVCSLIATAAAAADTYIKRMCGHLFDLRDTIINNIRLSFFRCFILLDYANCVHFLYELYGMNESYTLYMHEFLYVYGILDKTDMANKN